MYHQNYNNLFIVEIYYPTHFGCNSFEKIPICICPTRSELARQIRIITYRQEKGLDLLLTLVGLKNNIPINQRSNTHERDTL